MSYTVATYSYVGNGRIFIATRPTGGLRAVGNASKCDLSFDEETIEEPDYTRGGGGVRNSQSRVKKGSGSMDVYDFSPENLKLALRGAITTVAAGAVTGEALVAKLGCLIPFAFLPDPGETVTVKKGQNTVTATGNYTRTSSGIEILAAAAGLSDDDAITVDYTKHASYILEAMVNSGQEYRLFFEGLNDFDTGEPMLVDIYRIKFSPTKGLPLIGNAQLQLSLDFQLLPDPTKTGPNISPYFRATLAK